MRIRRRSHGRSKGCIFRGHQRRSQRQGGSSSSNCRDWMKKLTWRQSVVAVAFLLSLSLGIVFVIRAVRPAIYWHYHQDEPIRGWMTLGYVAHSYHVPPHVLHQALGLPDHAAG